MTERPSDNGAAGATLEGMWNDSREFRETVVRALAKVGLVWAVAVLAALFMVMASQGHPHHARPATVQSSADAPRAAGLAVAVAVLGAGAATLALGATRGQKGDRRAA